MWLRGTSLHVSQDVLWAGVCYERAQLGWRLFRRCGLKARQEYDSERRLPLLLCLRQQAIIYFDDVFWSGFLEAFCCWKRAHVLPCHDAHANEGNWRRKPKGQGCCWCSPGLVRSHVSFPQGGRERDTFAGGDKLLPCFIFYFLIPSNIGCCNIFLPGCTSATLAQNLCY